MLTVKPGILTKISIYSCLTAILPSLFLFCLRNQEYKKGGGGQSIHTKMQRTKNKREFRLYEVWAIIVFVCSFLMIVSEALPLYLSPGMLIGDKVDPIMPGVIPAFILMLLAAGGSLIIPLSIYGLIREPKERRRFYVFMILTSGLTIFSIIPGPQLLRWQIRKYAVARLAIRSQPLIEAINRFSADNGHPPDQLSDLTPKYIPSIPGTGMIAYPTYEYRQADLGSWELSVRPAGLPGWDIFYRPDDNYPPYIYPGKVDIVRDWAYVHPFMQDNNLVQDRF